MFIININIYLYSIYIKLMDKLFIINDLDTEYKKLYLESKKKYGSIRDVGIINFNYNINYILTFIIEYRRLF